MRGRAKPGYRRGPEAMPLANGQGQAPRVRKTGLKSHRDHQHHDPRSPGLSERHETLDPVRANALKVRFHGVHHRADPHDQLRLSGIGPGGADPANAAKVMFADAQGRIAIILRR